MLNKNKPSPKNKFKKCYKYSAGDRISKHAATKGRFDKLE